MFISCWRTIGITIKKAIKNDIYKLQRGANRNLILTLSWLSDLGLFEMKKKKNWFPNAVNYTSIDVITKLFFTSSGFRKNAIFKTEFHRWLDAMYIVSYQFVFQNIGCYWKIFGTVF